MQFFQSLILPYWHKSKLLLININKGVSYKKLKNNICNSNKPNWTCR